MKQKTLTTNTAFLLNMWFQENSIMFEPMREFIQKAHKEHWKKKNSGKVKVTFKIIK